MSRRCRAFAGSVLLLTLGGATLAGAAERFVAWGDDITLGVGDDAGLGGYPGRLQTLLVAEGRDVVVENWGLSGETTGAALSRMDTLTGTAADTFILMEGTNDLLLSISRKTIMANTAALLDKALERGFGKVMLATILPMSSKVSTELAPAYGRKLTQDQRQLGYDRQIDRPDAERGMFDLGPNLFKAYYADGKIHPNGRGYDALARVFLDYIQGRDTQAPESSYHVPNDGQVIPQTGTLQLVIFDPLTGVDQANSSLTLNHFPIPTTITGDIHRTVLTAAPGNLCGTNVLLGVSTRDLADPPNLRDEIEVIFSVKNCAGRVGDVDFSGRVDGVDLVLLGSAFGARAGDPRYLKVADIDGNRIVDGADLAKLAANFGVGAY